MRLIRGAIDPSINHEARINHLNPVANRAKRTNYPDATELQVERVKFLRYGEAGGDYAQVVATLNASDPHGR